MLLLFLRRSGPLKDSSANKGCRQWIVTQSRCVLPELQKGGVWSAGCWWLFAAGEWPWHIGPSAAQLSETANVQVSHHEQPVLRVCVCLWVCVCICVFVCVSAAVAVCLCHGPLTNLKASQLLWLKFRDPPNSTGSCLRSTFLWREPSEENCSTWGREKERERSWTTRNALSFEYSITGTGVY